MPRLFFALFAILIGCLPALAQTGWYDSDWKQRQVILIKNDTDSSLANHQIKIVVQYNPEMQADFDDVRFTDRNGVPLNYFRESFVPSSSAVFWVKVPALPARGEQTIHLYFDNQEPTTTSSGETVFDFFDDFSSGNLEEWATNGAGMSTSGGLLWLYTTDFHHVYTRNFTTTNGIVEASIKPLRSYNINVGARIDPASKTAVAVGNAGSFGKLYMFEHQPGFKILETTSFTQGADFNTFLLSLYQTTAKARVETTNPSSSVQIEGISSTPRSGPVGFVIVRGDSYVDWFRVRQYAPAEPSVTAGTLQSHDSVINQTRYEKLTCLSDANVLTIKADPPKILEAFDKCRGELAFKVGFNLTKDELYAVFCTIVSFRSAPYGTSTASGFTELLNEPVLDCDNYALLVGYLNELHCAPVSLFFVGMDGGKTGNHAQVFANDRLLLDPTIGLVALTNRDDVFNGQPVTKIVLFNVRKQLASFRTTVTGALQNGSYTSSDIIYTCDGLQSCLERYSDEPQ